MLLLDLITEKGRVVCGLIFYIHYLTLNFAWYVQMHFYTRYEVVTRIMERLWKIF